MPLQLAAPLIKTCTLDKSDKRHGNDGEPTIVIVRQATQAQHRQRQDLFATIERRYNNNDAPGDVSLIQTLSMEELKELEVYLCLCECNLIDADGVPLFPSKKGSTGSPELSLGRRQFSLSWGKLPPDIASEIHDKVLEVNPLWRGAEGEVL